MKGGKQVERIWMQLGCFSVGLNIDDIKFWQQLRVRVVMTIELRMDFIRCSSWWGSGLHSDGWFCTGWFACCLVQCFLHGAQWECSGQRIGERQFISGNRSFRFMLAGVTSRLQWECHIGKVNMQVTSSQSTRKQCNVILQDKLCCI